MEIDLLQERYPNEGPWLLARDLSRTIDSVCSQARRLGVHSKHRFRRRSLSRSCRSATVNTRFFDSLSSEVAFVLGYVWTRGTVKFTPRNVLRLSCPVRQEQRLLRVLGLLESMHRIQRYRNRLVCEVCNQRLIKSLVARFGCPPCSSNPDPRLPNLSSEYLPALVRGFLVSSDHSSVEIISWTGRPRSTAELVRILQGKLTLSDPVVETTGKRSSVSWTNPTDVQGLRHWLRLSKEKDRV